MTWKCQCGEENESFMSYCRECTRLHSGHGCVSDELARLAACLSAIHGALVDAYGVGPEKPEDYADAIRDGAAEAHGKGYAAAKHDLAEENGRLNGLRVVAERRAEDAEQGITALIRLGVIHLYGDPKTLDARIDAALKEAE